MINNPHYGIRDEWADAFDASFPLPEPGENEVLDSLVTRKRITIRDLVRIGGRWNPNAPNVVQFWWPRGVRFRDLVTDRRWVDPNSEWEDPKIVHGEVREKVVVVEGETDAARMSGEGGPGYDVLVLGGANNDNEGTIEALDGYEQVFIATDSDTAGDATALRLMKGRDNAVRWRPPDGEDWCSVEAIGPTPEPPKPPPLWVDGDELFDLDFPDVPSYLEGALLPHTGILVLHGWKGGYKSWLAFDLMAALATGGRWAEFETTMPELKAGVIQFEVPPYYYRDRMRLIHDHLPLEQAQRFRNLHHFSPFSLPQVNVNSEKWRDRFVAHAAEREFDVLLFDPIRQMVGVSSMNDQEAQQAIVQLFRALTHEGIAIVCTHHDSKTAARSGGGNMLDMTAGDVITGAADAVVSVQLPKGDDYETSKRRNLRFFVRNGPPVSARAFIMEDDVLHYQGDIHGGEDDDDATDIPSI